MVTDISASGRKWPKKHHTCGRNFKHWAEVNGAGPSAMVVEKDVVGPSAMAVESDSVGPSPTVTEVGRYAQNSRPDGQLSQHL